jgi:hypothetical protein
MPHEETIIDGVYYPSVTTIIGAQEKPWLKAWRDKWGPLAERKMEIASKIGTEFHKCVEEYLNTGKFTVDAALSSNTHGRIVGMMESFIDWAINVEGVIDETELKVISTMHTYSGTLDAVGTFAGKPLLYDWKTSSRVYPEMALQLSAYAEAYKEQTGRVIKEGMIVHVSKDKPDFKLTTKRFKLGKRIFNKFLKLREMFDDVRSEDK